MCVAWTQMYQCCRLPGGSLNHPQLLKYHGNSCKCINAWHSTLAIFQLMTLHPPLSFPLQHSAAPLHSSCSPCTSSAQDRSGPGKPGFSLSMGNYCNPFSLTIPLPLQVHESSKPKRPLQMRHFRRSSPLWTGTPPMPTASSLRCFSPLKAWKESSMHLLAKASSAMWNSETETAQFCTQGLRMEAHCLLPGWPSLC